MINLTKKVLFFDNWVILVTDWYCQ